MTAPASSRADRRPDVDWLRVIAVLLLVPFHTARIYDVFEPFYVKSATQSPALSYGIIAALNPWHMPLLFLLAGASSWFALQFRSPGAYARERLTRLLLPLLFGLAVIVPPQAYYAVRTQGGDPGSFLAFYPRYFAVNWQDLSGYGGTFTPGHLWFVLFLFVISLAALPLLLLLRSAQGRALISRTAAAAERPGVVLLAVLPLALAALLPDVGGKNPFYYLVFFLLGAILVADSRVQRSVDRLAPIALGVGVVTMAISITVPALGLRPAVGSPAQLGLGLAQTLNAWLWVVALLGLGRRYLSHGGPALRYASEAAYPFYILHQTVIIIIGDLVLRWQLPAALGFSVICLTATVGTLLIYELGVRRFSIARALFGLKPLASGPATRPQHGGARAA